MMGGFSARGQQLFMVSLQLPGAYEAWHMFFIATCTYVTVYQNFNDQLCALEQILLVTWSLAD